MINRNKKADPKSQQTQLVLYGFAAVCVASVLYVILDPQTSFSKRDVIDESSIMVHNGNSDVYFKQASNKQFEGWQMEQVNSILNSFMADNPQLPACRTSQEEPEQPLPMEFDWREKNAECLQEPLMQGSCSSAYALVATSVMQDRICSVNKKKVNLSAQEVIDCDSTNFHCEGGFVNRAYNWGKKNGFVMEACSEYTGVAGSCEDFRENACRYDKEFYMVNDYCLAEGPEFIKREIYKNGPVAAQMTVYTDFLTYKSGTYHRTEDAFKFNGQHVVKIVGWSKSQDGQDAWIFENTWGKGWGEDGYGRILMGDASINIDAAALGMAAIPISQKDLEISQRMQMQQNMHQASSSDLEDPDSEVDEVIDAEPVED